MAKRTTYIRALIGYYTRGQFGLSLPPDANPTVYPIRIQAALETTLATEKGTAIGPEDQIHLIESPKPFLTPGINLGEPDGNVVYGWDVAAPIGKSGGNAFSSRLWCFGQIEWDGQGPEKVVGWVSGDKGDGVKYDRNLQLALLRDPQSKPTKVEFFARNERSTYRSAMGPRYQEIPLDRVGLDYLYAKYLNDGQPDDSFRKHLLIWEWNLKNQMDFHGRVGKIEAL
jgi:hypothetical protein